MSFRAAGFLLALCVTSSTLSANRIHDGNMEFSRCKGDISAAVCSRGQDRSYYEHCISNEELQAARQTGRMPICMDDKMLGWCACGCFEAGTLIMSQRLGDEDYSWAPVEELLKNKDQYTIPALSDNASLSAISYKRHGIAHSTQSPEELPMVIIHTAKTRLAISSEHAVLLASGQMTEAKHLHVGQQLVSLHGAPTTIIQIDRQQTPTDVYNFSTTGRSSASHLIIAERMVVGDLSWQNELKHELGRILVRQ